MTIVAGAPKKGARALGITAKNRRREKKHVGEKAKENSSWSWLTGAGLLLMFFGGLAADSPGQGYLYAGAICLIGIGLAFLGNWLEERKQ